MFEGDIDGEDPEALATASPLNLLFEKALRQDSEAMHHLVTLLKTQQYQTIIGRLRSFGTGAHTETLDDIFQDSILNLMQRLEAGELMDLDEERRKNVLYYFQGVCHGRLRDVVRVRKSPVLQRHKAPLNEEIPDRSVRIPGEDHHAEEVALLNAAISRLEPKHAQILQMYRDGDSYEEMARATGKKEVTLRNLVARLKTVLVMDIQHRSAPARTEVGEGKLESIKVLPSWEEVMERISMLHPSLQEAIRFVHLEGHTVDELARTLGERGDEKARARIEGAYELLSLELNFPFPDVLHEVTPAPGVEPCLTQRRASQQGHPLIRLSGSTRNAKLPLRQQIEAAVTELPPEYRDAFLFVYRDGHPVGDLSESFDFGECLKAQHQLAEACRLLSLKFNKPFPETYQRAPKK